PIRCVSRVPPVTASKRQCHSNTAPSILEAMVYERPTSTSSSCQCRGSRSGSCVTPRVPLPKGPLIRNVAGGSDQFPTSVQNLQTKEGLALVTSECSRSHSTSLRRILQSDGRPSRVRVCRRQRAGQSSKSRGIQQYQCLRLLRPRNALRVGFPAPGDPLRSLPP